MLSNSKKINGGLQSKIPMCKPSPNIKKFKSLMRSRWPRMPGPANPEILEDLTPEPILRGPTNQKNSKWRRKGLTYLCNFPEVPPYLEKPYTHNNHGNWAIPLGLASSAFYPWNNFHPQNRNWRSFVQTGELPKGHEDNDPTDLRPKGMSSDRHTCVTRALYARGSTLAELVPPIRTRLRGAPRKPKRRHSPQPP